MKRNGFTLIELLLCLAILGIIAAIAIPAIMGAGKPSAEVGYASLVGKSKANLITVMGAPDGQLVIDDTTTAFVYTKVDIETNVSIWNKNTFKNMPVQHKTIFTVRDGRVTSFEVR